ncbi:MAG: hypothetical protein IIA62_07150, partial [Nitrospinae bacterium]|nr:hypothetical protein [Nitrospinota bacterium]
VSGGAEYCLSGRADINVSDIIDLKLDVIPSEPPPRHANIENFPQIENGESSASLDIQNKLANRSEGFLVKEIDSEINDILSEDVEVRAQFREYLDSLT